MLRGTFVWFLFRGAIVCLLINYNVAYDKTKGMATINARQRINVAQGARPGLHFQVNVLP